MPVPFLRCRLADGGFQFELLHAGQGLPQEMIEGDGMAEGRIKPGLKVMAMKPWDLASGRFQLQLSAQTEIGTQPPISISHGRESEPAPTV